MTGKESRQGRKMVVNSGHFVLGRDFPLNHLAETMINPADGVRFTDHRNRRDHRGAGSLPIRSPTTFGSGFSDPITAARAEATTGSVSLFQASVSART